MEVIKLQKEILKLLKRIRSKSWILFQISLQLEDQRGILGDLAGSLQTW